MTSISIPDFVLKMFEQKIVEINSTIVDKLCDRFDINKNEAHKFLEKELKINFKLINEDIEQIKIVKKHKKKEPVDITNQSSFCDARVFIATDVIVKQCSRSKLEGCKFCKSHQRLFEEGNLKYGTIHEVKPDCISTEKLNMKVKRTIY
jgi:hypothetical protein